MKEPVGMTMQQATVLRSKGVRVHGCWRCIVLGIRENQWREKDLKFNGPKALCPKHYRDIARVRDSQPIVTEMD